MLMVAAFSVGMFVRFDHAVDTQIDTDTDEKDGTNMPEPLLEMGHFLGQIANADCAVADEPSNEHDRQTCSETEDHRHEPIPRARQRQGDIYHGQEIDQTMRTEGDGEENTEYEGPQPAGVGVRILEKLANTVVVGVVVMSAEEQHDSADEHETRQDRFAPMTQHMLNTIGLRAHEKRNTEQNVRRQFTQHEHSAVAQHFAFIIDFLVDIADGGNTCHQRARVQYCEQSQ